MSEPFNFITIAISVLKPTAQQIDKYDLRKKKERMIMEVDNMSCHQFKFTVGESVVVDVDSASSLKNPADLLFKTSKMILALKGQRSNTLGQVFKFLPELEPTKAAYWNAAFGSVRRASKFGGCWPLFFRMGRTKDS